MSYAVAFALFSFDFPNAGFAREVLADAGKALFLAVPVFLVGLCALFVWHFIKAPPRLAAEAQERHQAERQELLSSIAGLEKAVAERDAELAHERRKPKPWVRMDRVGVERRGVYRNDGTWHGYAVAVVVPVVNDPPPGERGADAEKLAVTLMARTADGAMLLGPMRGRWFADGGSQPLGREVTLVPNGQPHELHLVYQFDDGLVYLCGDGGGMFAPKEEGFRIEEFKFSVELTVRGSNTEAITRTVGVLCGLDLEAWPEDQV
ncbi:MAG TPA: hypothetical protein VK988_20615 [Acidimicrobiales bacterium]|nr:hypothetical protein [Acidimicrobiales bacterium]